MSSKTTSRLGGWLLIAGLAGAAVYGVWFFPTAAEAGTVTADAPLPENAEADLQERFDAYARLRMAEDWVAVYDLVDPAQREVIDLATFLEVYGRGVLRTNELEFRSAAIDEVDRSAKVRAYSVSELVVARLPDQYRAGFRAPEDPEELRKAQEFSMTWVWSAGAWHYRMDQQVVDQHKRAEVL